MTARALADRVGVHVQHVFALERGRFKPSLTTLEKIAEALGVSVADLFAEAPERTDASTAFWNEYVRYKESVLAQEKTATEPSRGMTIEQAVERLRLLGLEPEDVLALGLVVAQILARRGGLAHKPDHEA